MLTGCLSADNVPANLVKELHKLIRKTRVEAYFFGIFWKRSDIFVSSAKHIGGVDQIRFVHEDL